MEPIIRSATERDVPSILGIINFEIENSTIVYDYKVRSYEYQLQWFHQKVKEGMPVIVAQKQTEVVGFGTFGIFRPWDAYRFSVEHSIYVDKKTRGLGIGKLLMAKLIDLATEQGYHTMVAGIDTSNKKSCDFHRKFGFTEIGTLKEIGFKFNTWLDLVFMQLLLDTSRNK
jgi:phosphinothricin acetyltransferase